MEVRVLRAGSAVSQPLARTLYLGTLYLALCIWHVIASVLL